MAENATANIGPHDFGLESVLPSYKTRKDGVEEEFSKPWLIVNGAETGKTHVSYLLGWQHMRTGISNVIQRSADIEHDEVPPRWVPGIQNT